MPRYDYDCAACGERFEVIHGVHGDPPTVLPAVRQWPRAEGDQRPERPFQGVRLGQEGAPRERAVRSLVEGRRRWGVGGRFEGRRVQGRRLEGRRLEGRRLDGLGAHGREAHDLGQRQRIDREADQQDPDRDCRLAMSAAADWITLAEAQAILAAANVHFTTSTIGGWARDGRLQSIKLGGRRYVRRGEVRALLAAPRRVPASAVQPALFEDLRD